MSTTDDTNAARRGSGSNDLLGAWVKTDEQLPPQGVELFATGWAYGDKSQGRYYSVAVYLGNDDWASPDDLDRVEHDHDRPTHWMLPPPVISSRQAFQRANSQKLTEEYENGYDAAWDVQQKEIDLVRKLLFDVLTTRAIGMDVQPINEAYDRACSYMRCAWPGWNEAPNVEVTGVPRSGASG